MDEIGDLPTACPSEYLITVTNTDITDNKVQFAGYGAETIDLGAPGAGAHTTALGNTYGGFGGTSGATPHVTGTIALLYSAPCQDFADLAISDPAAAARMVRDYILEGVDPNASFEGITTTGGRLNVNNAVQALMDNCGVLAVNDATLNADEISVYPNPSQGELTIKNNRGGAVAAVSVYSLDGRLLSELETITSSTINIEHLAQGAYVIMISFEGDSNVYNKIVVKK